MVTPVKVEETGPEGARSTWLLGPQGDTAEPGVSESRDRKASTARIGKGVGEEEQGRPGGYSDQLPYRPSLCAPSL